MATPQLRPLGEHLGTEALGVDLSKLDDPTFDWIQKAFAEHRSEERRVGKECRSPGSPSHEKKIHLQGDEVITVHRPEEERNRRVDATAPVQRDVLVRVW